MSLGSRRLSSHLIQLIALITFIWVLLLASLWTFHADTVRAVIPLDKFTAWPSYDPVDSAKDDRIQLLQVGDASPTRLALSSGRWQSNPAHQNLSLQWTDASSRYNCWSESELHPKGSGVRRSQDIDAWDWMKGDGEPLEDWSVERFVIRGLQSRFGYFMVGDSLTDGIFVALHRMLCEPNPTSHPLALERTYGHGPVRWKHATGPEVYYNNLTLNMAHSLGKALLERHDSAVDGKGEKEDELLGKIPRQRFFEPIVRFVRNSNLASEEEMEEILIEGLGIPLDWTIQLRTLAPWREYLASYADYDGWDGEKAGIVLINTGPHWEPDRFKPSTEAQMQLAYNLTMQKVYESLSALPSTLDLRILYRSTLPGHKDCEKKLYPVTKYDDAAVHPTGPFTGPYHWHWFPQYNDVARELWGLGRWSVRSKSRSTIEDKWERRHLSQDSWGSGIVTDYWDVWNLAATRPDAHVAWANRFMDCLHWCSGGVYAWVARAWWHTIVQEGL